MQLKRKNVTSPFGLSEAVIGFTQPIYEVAEDQKAVVNVKVTEGQIDVPVTVR